MTKQTWRYHPTEKPKLVDMDDTKTLKKLEAEGWKDSPAQAVDTEGSGKEPDGKGSVAFVEFPFSQIQWMCFINDKLCILTEEGDFEILKSGEVAGIELDQDEVELIEDEMANIQADSSASTTPPGVTDSTDTDTDKKEPEADSTDSATDKVDSERDQLLAQFRLDPKALNKDELAKLGRYLGAKMITSWKEDTLINKVTEALENWNGDNKGTD